MPSSLYQYRRFIWNRSWADLRHGYAGTSIGMTWNILHPLLLILIYSIVFGLLLKRAAVEVSVPYPIFLCSGLLPWIAFTECLTRGCNSFRMNSAYLKKLPIPEEAFVAQTALTATMTLTISFSILLLICAAVGVPVSWKWLLIPVYLLLMQATGFGLGLGLGAINAFIPDVGEAVPILLRLAFWTGPILFPASFFIDQGFGAVLALNPATPAIWSIHELLVFQRLPSVPLMFSAVTWAVCSWGFGFLVLRLLRSQIKDVL